MKLCERNGGNAHNHLTGGKALQKIQYPFSIKCLNKWGIEWTQLNKIKIIHSEEKQAHWIGKGCKLLSRLQYKPRILSSITFTLLLLSTVLEVIVRISKQDKEIKGVHTGKEEVRFPLLIHYHYLTYKKSQRSYHKYEQK